MRVLRHGFVVAARGLVVPLIGSVLLTWLCLGTVPHLSGAGADRAAALWLHLPGLLLATAALGAALEAWPLLSRDRPGAPWLNRVERRPLHGCPAAAIGALAALAVALFLAGLGFVAGAAALGVDLGEVHTRIPTTPSQSSPYLDGRQETMAFRLLRPEPIRRVQLRPLGIFGPEATPADLQVSLDGRPLHPDQPWIANAGDRIDLAVDPPRSATTLEVRRRTPEGIALRIEPDRIEIVAAAPRSQWWNCVLALSTYLVTAALALSVMILGHRFLVLPVNFAAGLVTVLLAVLTAATPNTVAVTAAARGQWLLGEGGVLVSSGWALGGILVILALAWLASSANERAGTSSG